MTKTIKMSLVAAVAVAGLSSTASAGNLEEMIKGVQLSGSIGYRYDDRSTKDGITNAADSDTERTRNTYKASGMLTVPVNDVVTAKVNAVASTPRGGLSSRNGTADANVNWQLSQAHFIYSGIANTAVIAGKQSIPGPWTDAGDSFNPSNTGSGLVAQTKVGPVTIAAAHFLNTNVNASGGEQVALNDKDITALAVIGDIGPVNAQLWYAKGQKDANTDLQDGFTGLTAIVSGSFGPISAELRHSTLKVTTVDLTSDNIVDRATINATLAAALVADGSYDAATEQLDLGKQKLTALTVGGDFGMFGFDAGYAKGGSNGSLVAFEEDADNVYGGWAVTAGDSANMNNLKAYHLSANVNVTDKINLSATYVKAKWDATDYTQAPTSTDLEFAAKAKETYAQVTYNMSDNFSTYVRYGVVKNSDDRTEIATDDRDSSQQRGRLQMLYRF